MAYAGVDADLMQQGADDGVPVGRDVAAICPAQGPIPSASPP